MVDFRRMIPVLAVLAFLLGSAVPASAQAPFSCIASGATNTPVRFEGLTELVGDFLVTCTGGVSTLAGAQVPTVNIQIFLNAPLTSRCMVTGNTGCLGSFSEALLLLDDPAPTVQFGCPTATCIAGGQGAGLPVYGNGTQTTSAPFNVNANRNVFQGVQTASNAVSFIGIPIDPPGTTGVRTIRITNIRANVNVLGTSAGNSAPPAVTATITTTPQNTLPINSNATQAVGSVQRGLNFSLRSGTNGSFSAFNAQQCVSRSNSDRIAQLRFQELFATAFKKRSSGSGSGAGVQSIPSDQNDLTNQTVFGNFNTETGFRNSTLTLPAPSVSSSSGTVLVGDADWGTRLKATFNSLPAGIRLWVDPRGIVNTPDYAQLTSAESAIFSSVGTTSPVELTITNGSATAVWEVLQSDPTTLADLRFGVYTSYTANPGNNSPALGSATVNGSYAPTSTVAVAVASSIPRFVDTSQANTIFTVVPCVTNLLFPFVTSQLGFDTGIAISSTSTDPFATSPQSGTCTLNWYGAAFTGATPTPIVTSGTTHTLLTSQTLSNVAGGFSGYMIAVCRFQFAHGFAFVSDLGARNIAMGYLALVIPDPARAPNPVSVAGPGSGEQLAQ